MSGGVRAARETDALIAAAADGRLPSWAIAGDERRAHLGRVAGLLDHWAGALGLDGDERLRWRAAGWLHDALRDAPADELRPMVPPELRDVPDPLLHGPAAAARLEADGAGDGPLRFAVAYHTLGHPELDRLGRALYLADFLEPGRTFRPGWRARLRARMPDALSDVLVQVVAARIRHLLETRRTVRPETVEFWNALASDR